MIKLPGYSNLVDIYSGPRSLVLRGDRDADGRSVVIKMPKADSPHARDILRLKQHYQVAGYLSFSGVVKPYSLEQEQHRLALLLEDFGGRSLRDMMRESSLSIECFLELAVRVAEIVGEMHNQDVVHKDINPAHILVNPQTGAVKLTDFGIASRLSLEEGIPGKAKTCEGTPAYMSPEQTGRMNRSVDFRSDFYSLGVTFYELLTETLPFEAADLLEMVHSHIARHPTPPHEVNKNIPSSVSKIVMKLLSKTAEDRYKSAYGLRSDLEACLDQWRTGGSIMIEAGHRDRSGRFRISQKLYGRDREIGKLMSAFQRVNEGSTEWMLVTGHAGIGKSALIQEIYKPITWLKGHFISGKFDHLERGVPYSALIQAFQELVMQLLGESERRLSRWKETLEDVLGPNGQIIIDVIPEVEMVIGKQEPTPSLPPVESRNRFNMVFRDFVRTFAAQERPLVIFLDDLQWADAASLKLVELLLTDPDTAHVFLIGAYRDHEVDAGHLLTTTISDAEKKGASISRIKLGPLEPVHVRQLLEDTLWSQRSRVQSLSQLVLKKTGGNPFFIGQFLQRLHDDGLIVFDHVRGRWIWDLAKIARAGITDDVVELLLAKLKKLSLTTQETLRSAACIGNRFDLETLCTVCEAGPAETLLNLWEALEGGMVVSVDAPATSLLAYARDVMDEFPRDVLSASFAFHHDRILQAAYQLIPEENKKAIHLQVGRCLLSNPDTSKPQTRLFMIADQLNMARQLIEKPSERCDLARLNFQAGKKAKASMAYEPALRYLRVSAELLPENSWPEHFELTQTIHIALGECAFLNARFDEAERVFDRVLEHARTKLEKVEVYTRKAVLYTNVDRAHEALRCGREGLKLLGTRLPRKGRKTRVMIEALKARRNLRGRRVQDLVVAPELTDRERLAESRLLRNLIAPSYNVDTALMGEVAMRMANLSLRHGHTEFTSSAYIVYAMVLMAAVGDVASGYAFGKLALELNDRFRNAALDGQLHTMFAAVISPWVNHVDQGGRHLKEGHRRCLETGDYVYAGYAAFAMVDQMLFKGAPLNDVDEAAKTYLASLRRINAQTDIDMIVAVQRLICNLRGETKSEVSFSSEQFHEDELVSSMQASTRTTAIHLYHVLKLQSLFIFGYHHEALHIAKQSLPCIDEVTLGVLGGPEFYFPYALTLCSLYTEVSRRKKVLFWKEIRRCHRKFARWASAAPDNFRHKQRLIAAEMHRLRNRDERAMELYEEAAQWAGEHGFLQDEAISYEAAGKFYLARGLKSNAKAHMIQARIGYRRWDAIAKVVQITAQHEDLFPSRGSRTERRIFIDTRTESYEDVSGRIDLNAILEASQSLSSEYLLGALLERMMRIAMQHAGADRGLLLLQRDRELYVEAECSSREREVNVLQSIPLAEHGRIGVSIVKHASRTRQSVVLHDARRDERYGHDPYVARYAPKSILCIPIVAQGITKGVFYFENSLASGSFHGEQVDLLQLLAAQSAMAIGQAESKIDNLTRLWLRASFMEQVREALDDMRGEGKQSGCVMMVDLDFFKTTNDTYGHMAGDIVLRQVANRMQDAIGADGLIGRFGGEEFVVFLPRASLDEGQVVAERMLLAVGSEPIAADEQAVYQTVSIGLSLIRGNGPSLEETIELADKALYQAKRSGRNRFVVSMTR